MKNNGFGVLCHLAITTIYVDSFEETVASYSSRQGEEGR
jgi:hypothetical protein